MVQETRIQYIIHTKQEILYSAKKYTGLINLVSALSCLFIKLLEQEVMLKLYNNLMVNPKGEMQLM